MRKSQRDSRVYLKDMLKAIDLIEQYIAGRERDFFKNGLLQDAVIRQVSIIGEAASKLPQRVRAASPDVPWKLIIGMRNIVIHDYSEINIERVWTTIEHDLPPLRRQIKALLRASVTKPIR